VEPGSAATLLVWGKSSVHPASGTTVSGKTASFIVLDRVADMNHPPYQVCGFCTCLACGAYCYLGSESIKLVAAPGNDTYPLCIRCANEHIPRERMGDPDDHVQDARA
jgi:hypothetical protein